ncbi:PadR family transcriptional regulator [Photobacterium toruni]|uniref:PadR family transcriptional regulator n=1 Tax=Photobacterium toruni TaxID=1935446 RepID=A0ABU6L9U0_9GAMM|nr:PadR family transcriptional regulator [Photobacterium toruni]
MNIKSELQKAVLLFLTESSMTGYEICKELMATQVWTANHQQVYRELHLLNDKLCVEFEEIPQNGKPDKKLYSITDIGRSVVSKFSQSIDIKKTTYHSESTLMLKACNSNYFNALKEKLTLDIELLEIELPRIDDEIEYAILYRQLSMMRTERDYAKSALLTIKSIKHQQQLSKVA